MGYSLLRHNEPISIHTETEVDRWEYTITNNYYNFTFKKITKTIIFKKKEL